MIWHFSESKFRVPQNYFSFQAWIYWYYQYIQLPKIILMLLREAISVHNPSFILLRFPVKQFGRFLRNLLKIIFVTGTEPHKLSSYHQIGSYTRAEPLSETISFLSISATSTSVNYVCICSVFGASNHDHTAHRFTVFCSCFYNGVNQLNMRFHHILKCKCTAL